MTKKVKLSDVARDLQIPTQELIGFYQERDEKGNTKKGVTGLTPEEINLALEYYSQKTQVDSLDAYLSFKIFCTCQHHREDIPICTNAGNRKSKNRQIRFLVFSQTQ